VSVARFHGEEVTQLCESGSCGDRYRITARALRRIRQQRRLALCPNCRTRGAGLVSGREVSARDRRWAERTWAAMSDEDRMLVSIALGSLPLERRPGVAA